MMKPAFSTVACPEWTLAQVAERAQSLGFEAVELRTFGDQSAMFACDPALTSGEKVRRIVGERGVEILSLATSTGFEEPVRPPVIGYAISDTERTVRAAQRAIDLAVAIECPYVRVFGFDVPAREGRASAMGRMVKRLTMVADHAHNMGIRIVIENGGAFGRATEVMQLVKACQSPLIGVCYNLATGFAAGDSPQEAIQTIGDRLWVGRIKDLKDRRPCELGMGDVPCEVFVRALMAREFEGPLVYEWDRAWIPELAPAEQVLGGAAAKIWSWLGSKTGAQSAAKAMPMPTVTGRRK